MKKNRIAFVLMVVLISVLLTSCGALPVTNWPGLTVDQDIVYVAEGGSLLAVNATGAQAGVQKWRYPADKPDATKQLFSEPTVSGGLVLIGSQYANGNVFYALDAASGVEKWTFKDAKGKWLSSPVVVGDLIIAPNGDGHIYALSMDGKPKWTFAAKGGFWATPVSDGKTVFAPSLDRSLYAIDAATGSRVWDIALESAALYRPILVNDTIYLSTLGKQVLAVSSKDGAILWKAAVAGTVFGSPVLSGDKLYIADENSKLYAFSAKDGSKSGEWDTPGAVVATVAAFSKGIVVVTEAGGVVAYSETGEKLFNQTINGKLYSRPAVVQDTIIVGVTAPTGGSIDKVVVAYDATGKEIWSVPVPK